MTSESDPVAALYGISEDGTRETIQGSGLRISLGSGMWALVDFGVYYDPFAASIIVGFRWESNPTVIPLRLGVFPRSRNGADAEIGELSADQDSAMEVHTVTMAEGDRRSLLDEAAASGDPVRQVLWDTVAQGTTAHRAFELDLGETGVVKLALLNTSNVLRVSVQGDPRRERVADAEETFSCLGMRLRALSPTTVEFLFATEHVKFARL